MRKNLQHIQIEKWEVGSVELEEKSFSNSENIPIKSEYSQEDIKKLEHLDFGAGFPPFLRGINSTMYVRQPWVIRQDLDGSQDLQPDFLEAGATADIEIAHTLLKGLGKIKEGLSAGMKIDELAAPLTFSFRLSMNHFMNIAKLRAARLIWAKLMQQFHPKDPKSMALQIHCQTSERSLKPHEPYENVSRTCVEAMAGVFGGIQSLQIPVLDESVTDLDDFLGKIALNTQLYLQEETKITKTVDPWGGSFYVESLTHDLVQKVWKQIEELEK